MNSGSFDEFSIREKQKNSSNSGRKFLLNKAKTFFYIDRYLNVGILLRPKCNQLESALFILIRNLSL